MIRLLLYWCMLLFLFFSSCTSKTVDKVEQKRNDSIQKYLDLAGSDTVAYEKRIKYNDKAYSLIDLNRNDTLTRYYLYCVSYKYYSFNKNDMLKSAADKLMDLSLKSKDSINIAKAYRNLGLFYIAVSDNEKAILFLFKAKKIFKFLNRNDYVIKVMNNIAITQYYASDFLGSNKTLVEILSLSKKTNFTKMYPFALLNIGNNLSSLKNESQAIIYFKKAYRISHKKTLKKLKNVLNNNISNSYINLKQYDSASKYVSKNLSNKKLLFLDPEAYSNSISLYALIQLKMNNHNKLKEKFYLAERYFEQFNVPNGRNYNQIYLSFYFSKVKDSINALKAAEKALSLSKSYKNPTDILVSLEQLIKVDKKNASTNAQEYIRISDSMQISERNFRDKFARIAYETDEISQEKNKAVNQKWIISSILGVIILFVLLILIITRQRAKQNELALLQEQQKANEEIYQLMLMQKTKEDEAKQSEKKRIAQELHDGIMNKLSSTRLNLSMLSNKTDKETIQKCITYINGINQIETEIRTISHDLNKELFQKEDSYTKMVEDFVKEQNKISKTHFELEIDKHLDWNTVSSEIKMHLYRIIQEATHNINKYAHAKKAAISILLDYSNICMAITDNGIGFDNLDTSKGIGIQNMQARVKSLNGKFNISSKKLESTSINIAIPLK